MVYGEGGFGSKSGTFKRKVLQLIHAAYNLQDQFKRTEWYGMWQSTANAIISDDRAKKQFKMQSPVLTRW